MRIIGVDLHARQQTVAALDTDSGEVMETTLQHSPQDQEEVRSFYAALPRPALVGLEASGSMQWFLGLLDELGVEYSVGHPTEIRKAESRKQKLAELPLAPYTAGRRNQLQALRQKLETQISKLDEQVQREACRRPLARLLMTHPGVGPVTALASEVFLGDPARFADGKAVASYVGMIPSEHSSGGRQRLGRLSKQGNPFLRFLWVEVARQAVRKDPALQRFYRRKVAQKGFAKALVAAARKLGIRLWIMLREQIDYQEFCRRGQQRQSCGAAYAGMPVKDFGPATP